MARRRSLKSQIYRGLRVWNDINAVQRGRAPRRVARRAYGKVTGRIARRLFG
jgi:hypothetical protein